MINIPDSIKERLHRDTCPKNIRIHFPNGERSDICNDLIVKDSVSFTESLVSQDTLKFGLCESPVFECEVVGVGNIKGATIEVTCEIYHTNSDGAVFRPDIQKYVYPIPYGTFIVQECKRQADLNHRKIVAYNVLAFYDFKMNDFQLFRAKHPNSALSPFSQKLIPFISENTQSNAFGCPKTELTSTIRFFSEVEVDPMPSIYTNYIAQYYIGYKITEAASNKLYYIEIENPDDEPIDDRVFVEFGSYTTASVYVFLNVFGGPHIRSAGGISSFYIYPYMSMTSQADNNAWFKTNSSNYDGAYISVHFGYTRYQDRSPLPIITDYEYIDPDNVHIYELTIPDDFAYAFERALDPSQGKFIVANPEAVNMRDVFNGYLETIGMFGLFGRSNEFKFINIKRQFYLMPDNALYPDPALYPQGVTGGQLLPEDYQSCWYDDQYTKPFGAIVCEYKNTLNEDCVFTFYLSGYDEDTPTDTYQTYDLSNNNLIKSDIWTEQQISDICNTIAQNIEGVQYMPVDFVGRGLPYVEAGDTFEILTKSNDSITTIVLNRTLTGEQVLTDKYKSV